MDRVERAVNVTGPIGPPKGKCFSFENQANRVSDLHIMPEGKQTVPDDTPTRAVSRRIIMMKKTFIPTEYHALHSTVDLYLCQ